MTISCSDYRRVMVESRRSNSWIFGSNLEFKMFGAVFGDVGS